MPPAVRSHTRCPFPFPIRIRRSNTHTHTPQGTILQAKSARKLMDPVHYNDERDEDETKAAANRKVNNPDFFGGGGKGA